MGFIVFYFFEFFYFSRDFSKIVSVTDCRIKSEGSPLSRTGSVAQHFPGCAESLQTVSVYYRDQIVKSIGTGKLCRFPDCSLITLAVGHHTIYISCIFSRKFVSLCQSRGKRKSVPQASGCQR